MQRLREATEKVTGEIIKGWFRKSGYLIPGEAAAERPADPNAGVEDRCSLPADARFQRREHVACYDSEGQLRREKEKGKTKWTKYDEINEVEEDLQNISVSKRKAVRPQKRQKVSHCPLPEESCDGQDWGQSQAALPLPLRHHRLWCTVITAGCGKEPRTKCMLLKQFWEKKEKV